MDDAAVYQELAGVDLIGLAEELVQWLRCGCRRLHAKAEDPYNQGPLTSAYRLE